MHREIDAGRFGRFRDHLVDRAPHQRAAM